MKNNFCVLMFMLAILASCKKPEPILVTNQNKRDVLTRFGQENQEKTVVIETEFGTIKLRLYDETPFHRANFIKLIKDGYYTEESQFYRVVEKFVVQGGVPGKKLDYTIPAEFNPKFYHKRGALAMARQDENNPGKESSSTEFYIVHGNKYSELDLLDEEKLLGARLPEDQRKIYTSIGGELSLDGRYTVFGEVTEGMDVVDQIATVRVFGEKPYQKISFKIHVEP